MGNEIGDNPASGQIINKFIDTMVSKPASVGKERDANYSPNPLTRRKNLMDSRLRGDTRHYTSEEKTLRRREEYNFRDNAPNGRSNIDYAPRIMISNMAGSQVREDEHMRSRITGSYANEQSRLAIPGQNMFNRLFAGSNVEERNIRSSSVSHQTVSAAERRVQQLQSAVIGLQKRIQQTSSALQNSQQNCRNLESNLNTVSTKNALLQTYLKRGQQRNRFLQSQINTIRQQLSNTRMACAQRDRQLFECDLRIKAQINQLELLDRRLQEGAKREQAKDKDIRELGAAKVDLNAAKIRLEESVAIMEEQLKERMAKIAELDSIIVAKNTSIETMRAQKESSQHSTMIVRSQLQRTVLKHEEYVNKLDYQLHSFTLQLQNKEDHIQQLTLTVSHARSIEQELRNSIRRLEADLQMNKDAIARMEGEISQLEVDMQSRSTKIEELSQMFYNEKVQSEQYRGSIDRLMEEHANARKTGQKQIEYLQGKVQELQEERVQLIEAVEMAKVLAVERNKIFERNLIYELKEENSRLWAKMIEMQDKQLQANQYPEANKSARSKREGNRKSEIQPNEKQTNGPKKEAHNQFQQRYLKFMSNLSGDNQIKFVESTKQIRTSSLNVTSAQLQNTHFYKQKCSQLEKLVQSHIGINKTLKQQIEKHSHSNSNLKLLVSQLQTLRFKTQELQLQNEKLEKSARQSGTEHQLKQRKLEAKVAELQSQNSKHVQQIKRLAPIVESLTKQQRKISEQNRRLNYELAAQQKWESMYVDLKRRYDESINSRKKDYKQQYDQLAQELQRIKGVYALKDADIDRLKHMHELKNQQYEEQLRHKNGVIDELQREYSRLVLQNRSLQDEIEFRIQQELKRSFTPTSPPTPEKINKEEIVKVYQIFVNKTREIEALVKKIREKCQQTNAFSATQLTLYCEQVIQDFMKQCASFFEHSQ